MTQTGRPPLSPYGEQLDRLMRRKGLRSTADLSRFLGECGLTQGVAQQTLSYHMLGRTQPKPALVERILDALEASEEDRSEIRSAFFRTEWSKKPSPNGD